MIQLEKKLEKSAQELTKLTLNNEQLNNKEKQNLSQEKTKQNQEVENTSLSSEMVKQIEIPIAYTANAEVISTQNSVAQTILDLKA